MGDTASPGAGLPSARLTPEVEPLTSVLLHPLLQDPKFLLAVLAVLLTAFLYTVVRPSPKLRRGRSGTPTVLLLGPTDSGKTALFAKLAHSSRIESYTSVIPSSTTFHLSLPDEAASKPITLVDLPGHPRLRDEARRALRSASAVVFAVDIQSLLRNAGSVAEELPPILTTLCSLSSTSSEPLRLLILACKADLLIRPPPSGIAPSIPAQTRQTAVERLQSVLTREMDRLKQTRAGTGGRIEGISKVASSGGSWWKRIFGGAGAAGAGSSEGEGEVEEDEGLVWGGKGAFKWEDIEGVEVSWGVAALGGPKASGEEGGGLDEVKQWLWDI